MGRVKIESVLVLVIVVTLFFSGCVEVNRQTQSYTTPLFSFSVTKVQYLWTNEGPLTFRYIVDASIPIAGQFHREMGEGEYNEWLEGISSSSAPRGTPIPINVSERKNVGATAVRSGSTITFNFMGGPDAQSAESIAVEVTASNGWATTRTLYQPAFGQSITFEGLSSVVHIKATATFDDESQQVILDTSL